MTQTLVVPTHYEDLAELAEGLAERVEAHQLILFGPMPFDEDVEVSFQVLLGDESIALEGRGRAAASVDGGEERDQEYRYDIVIDSLELNDRFMAVYDRILLMRNDSPSTNEHEVVDADAIDEFPSSAPHRIDETTEFGVEGDTYATRVSESNFDSAENYASPEEGSEADAVVDADGLVDEVSVVEAVAEDLYEEPPGTSEPPRFSEQPSFSSRPPSIPPQSFPPQSSPPQSSPPQFSSRPPSFPPQSFPPQSSPPQFSSRPPSFPPQSSAPSMPSRTRNADQLAVGERTLYPEPEAPQKPPAPQVTPLGQGLSRPSSAKAYSLEPDDEETLYPSPTGLFQYAKGELPAPQAPARPREQNFRPVQPAPSLAPIAPRGSTQGFAENIPSLRPLDVQLLSYTDAPPPQPASPATEVSAYDSEGGDIESVPVEAFDEVHSIPAEAADELVSSADDEADDADAYEDDVESLDSAGMSSDSLHPDALSGDTIPPESPKRDA